MDDTKENTAQTVERLSELATNFDVMDFDPAGHPFIRVPNGHSIVDLEQFMANPIRIRASNKFIALESFNRYINSFKLPGTRIDIQRNGCAHAVLDGHEFENPHWGSHTADFQLSYSERWQLWDGKNKKTFSQKDFTEFVEDNTVDFFAPSGGSMLDIARTLDAEQSSKVVSALKDPQTGDVALKFERTTTAKAGQKGDLEVPTKFTISVPVLEGEDARQIEVRLRYALEEGKVTFSFEILRRAQLLEDVRRSVYAIIANETKIQPYLI